MRLPTQTAPLDPLFAEVEQAWNEGRGYDRACELAEQHPAHACDLFGFLDALIAIALGTTPDAAAETRSAAALADRLETSGDPSLADAVRRSAGLVAPDRSAHVEHAAGPPRTSLPPAPEPPPALPGAAPAVQGSPLRRVVLPESRPAAGDRPAERAAAVYPAYAAARLVLKPGEVARRHGVPMRFLQQIDAHPGETPLRALEVIARRGADLGLDFDEALGVLLAEPSELAAVPMAASSAGPLRPPTPFSYRELVERNFRDQPAERDFWLSFAA